MDVSVPVPDLVEVVGGLTEFLREIVPGIDIFTWEKRVEAEKDFRSGENATVLTASE